MSVRHLMGGAAIVALASICAVEVQAQETTGDIRGQVTDASGAPIGGASVTILDTRTNTASQSTTDATGDFSAHGLRVGGPYTVSVASSGYAPEQIDGVAVSLGETVRLNVSLDPTATEVIVVTADRAQAVDVALGPAATFTLEDLETAPAINRSIVDVIRSDPRIYVDEAFVDSVQCVGSNPRFNSLTVDGVRLNDNFGLNSNGFPTERSPFSFDAIEQVAVEMAPFDVQYGGFSACNINAVTKTGANEFFGGAFIDYTSDALTGDSLEGADVNVAEFDEIRYGINVGGPIVQDKLFFFASYEKLEGANTFDRGPEGSGAVAEVVGFTQEDYDRIVQIARDVYQYEPGGTPSSFDNEDEKFLVKIDWNISNNHRANFVYNYNDGFNITESDSDPDEFEFDKHLYERGAELNSYVGSLFSDWTNAFSTEVRIGKVELDNRQISVGGADFAEIIVFDDGNAIYLGGDDSRQSNKLDYEVFNLVLKGDYRIANHDVTFGYEREALDIFNLFVQHTQGQIEFNSIDFFEAGIFDDYDYANAPSGDPNDAAAQWGYAVNTAYAQDEWSFDNGLTLIGGLRYDWYESDDVPAENPQFLAEYGFTNAQNLDGEGLLQPRLGFQWEVNDALSLRGGVGLYSGGNPNVWLSNNYSANNVTQFTVNEGNLRDHGLYVDDVTTVFDLDYVNAEEGTPGDLPGWGVPSALVDYVSAGEGSNFEINVLDPNFEIPSEWKYALGATYIYDAPIGGPFGGEYMLNGDLLFSDGQDTAIISRLDLVQTGTVFGGRIPTYASPNADAFVLTNSSVGNEAFSASFSVQKSHDFGLDWTLGYAYTDAEDVQPMTSSVAFSNYNNRAFLDPNEEVLSTSNYNIKHRVTLTGVYEHEFIDDYQTSIGVYASANSGRPFSFAFEDPNSIYGFTPFLDGGVEIYVPTGPDDPNVVFDPGFDQAAFFDFVDREGLSKYAGDFAPRNAFEGGWWTKVDLKLEQEFPGARPGDRSAAFLVVDNLGNLINDEWGILREAGFPRVANVVDASLSDDGSQLIYNSFREPNIQPRVGSASLWSIRVGLRYEF